MANYHSHPFPLDKILSPSGFVLLMRSLPFCEWFGHVYLYCMILDLSSCAGRCGEGYSRDTPCNCDYNCQHYLECCPDFKKFCTVGKCQAGISSVKHRCPRESLAVLCSHYCAFCCSSAFPFPCINVAACCP